MKGAMAYLTRHWPIRAGGRGWLIAAAAAALALALLSLVDVQISDFGQALPAAVVTAFDWITRLGGSDWILYPSLIGLLVCGVATLLVRRFTPRLALWQLALVSGFVFIGVGLPSLVTTIVKRLIGRGRPELLDAVGPFDFRTLSWLDWTYQSFPSGHATTGFALCFTVSFLAPRSFPVMLVIAVLIGLSRIVLGAHFATDVLAGALVGTLGAYFVRNVFAWRRWVFEFAPDGTVLMRPLAAIRRLLTRRRGLSQRRP
jgi:membrane-associated phospholipid phosphatase